MIQIMINGFEGYNHQQSFLIRDFNASTLDQKKLIIKLLAVRAKESISGNIANLNVKSNAYANANKKKDTKKDCDSNLAKEKKYHAACSKAYAGRDKRCQKLYLEKQLEFLKAQKKRVNKELKKSKDRLKSKPFTSAFYLQSRLQGISIQAQPMESQENEIPNFQGISSRIPNFTRVNKNLKMAINSYMITRDSLVADSKAFAYTFNNLKQFKQIKLLDQLIKFLSACRGAIVASQYSVVVFRTKLLDNTQTTMKIKAIYSFDLPCNLILASLLCNNNVIFNRFKNAYVTKTIERELAKV